MKSGNLNFLEPFGPLQACKGTALPLRFKSRKTMVKLIEVFSKILVAEFQPSKKRGGGGSKHFSTSLILNFRRVLNIVNFL